MVIADLFFMGFPWISAAFLCVVPDFLARLQRGKPADLFYVMDILYMILFALFLYGFLCRGDHISGWSDAIGAAGAILLHVPGIWKTVSGVLYSRMRGTFPFNCFLYEILAILYLFHWLHHHKVRKGIPG